jgi:hypothetical protein
MSAELEAIDAVRMATLESLMGGIRIGDTIVANSDARCCVFATRIALKALERYGVFGRALKVHVAVYNRWGWEWQQANPDKSLFDELMIIHTIAIEAGDHSIEFCERVSAERGIHPKARYRFCGHGTDLPNSFALAKPGWLNGHVVALLNTDAGHVLLDVTAPQFTTPQFKLFIEPLALPVTDEWARDPGKSWLQAEPECLNGGAMFYIQPNDLDGLFNAPDWIQSPERIRGLADGVVAQADERLALMRL